MINLDSGKVPLEIKYNPMSEDRSKAFAPREAANDDNVISTGQNERSNSKTLGNPWEKDANKYLAADEEILGTEAQKYRLNNTDPAESTSLSARTISAEDIESPPQIDAKVIDVPPDGGYGWVCVACVFLINAHTWGLNSVRFPTPLILFFKITNQENLDLWCIPSLLPGKQHISWRNGP
jgi:hypothetical protein